MGQKLVNSENTKRWKALELRYRKAIVRELNIETIHDMLLKLRQNAMKSGGMLIQMMAPIA